MQLNDEERAMLAGEAGEPRRWAIAHQIAVGEFFDAADLVAGEPGAHHGRHRVPWAKPGCGFSKASPRRPRPSAGCGCRPSPIRAASISRSTSGSGRPTRWRRSKRRAIAALQAFGVLMTDTCINYQTIMPPVRGEHLAMGDTGVVIYSNSVFGARSNFEGGPSALAAGADRPHAALRLSSRRMPARHAALSA